MSKRGWLLGRAEIWLTGPLPMIPHEVETQFIASQPFPLSVSGLNPSLSAVTVTVVCHVIPASGRLVDVDIPELSESPWPGLDIFWTSMRLGRQIVKELDLKLTLGMAERRLTESPPDEESWGGGQVQISVRPKVTLSRSLAVSCPIDHSTG